MIERKKWPTMGASRY